MKDLRKHIIESILDTDDDIDASAVLIDLFKEEFMELLNCSDEMAEELLSKSTIDGSTLTLYNGDKFDTFAVDKSLIDLLSKYNINKIRVEQCFNLEIYISNKKLDCKGITFDFPDSMVLLQAEGTICNINLNCDCINAHYYTTFFKQCDITATSERCPIVVVDDATIRSDSVIKTPGISKGNNIFRSEPKFDKILGNPEIKKLIDNGYIKNTGKNKFNPTSEKEIKPKLTPEKLYNFADWNSHGLIRIALVGYVRSWYEGGIKEVIFCRKEDADKKSPVINIKGSNIVMQYTIAKR